MINYYDVFPEKARTELRSIVIVNEGQEETLPSGIYLFTEFFCPDLGCDCQRVLLKVFWAATESSTPEDVATISYTWTEPQGDRFISGLPNPFLDPLQPQADYAKELMEMWEAMLNEDFAYQSRLVRHYSELRAAVGESSKSVRGPKFLAEMQTAAPRRTSKQRRRLLEQIKRRRKLGR